MTQIQKQQWYGDRASLFVLSVVLSIYWPKRRNICGILQAAVISLGLIGAGTNNARIAGMLRNLSSYYYKEASLLFCVKILLLPLNSLDFLSFIQWVLYIFTPILFWPLVQVRIAQGLVHLGKGLLTLAPYHSDRFLLSP